MKRKLLSFLTLVLVIAMAIVPMLAITASAEDVALEITKDDFNSTSYVANNNTKTENGYSYTSYQVMDQSGTMQWKKNEGYITISANSFSALEIKSTAGTFTVKVGGVAVASTGTATDGAAQYDLTGKTGEIKISVGSATGKTTYIKFYAAPAASDCDHVWNEGEETLAPGKETVGTMTYTCTLCGETKDEEIPAIGYVASFVVPEGATAPENKNGLKVTMPEAVNAPAEFNMYTYKFAGWTTGTVSDTEDKPTVYKAGDEVAISEDTTFYAIYTYALDGTGETSWNLVTNVSDLEAGDKIIIAASGSGYAIGTTQNTNNRVAVTITKGDGTATIGDTVQVITVEKGTTSGTYAFNVGNGYLFAASSSSNHLRTESTLSANSSWKITITEDGVASITAQGSNTRNQLKKNSSSALFSCYGSGQQDICIYKASSDGTLHYTTELQAKPVITEPEFTGASIVIGADLSVKYYVVLPEGEAITGYAVKFTMNGLSVVVTDCEEKDGEYVFTFTNIAPQCIGDVILAELVKDDAVVAEKDGYSIKAYAQNKLNDSKSSDTFKQLLTDLLYYGAAAQKHQSYKLDAIVTDGVENIGTPSTTTPTDADNGLTGAASTDATREFKFAGVKFDFDNKLYVKFIAPSLDDIVVKVGGEEAEIVDLGNGTYQVYSKGILATEFGTAVEFELIYNDATIQTMTYSVNTYALSKYDSENALTAELALAMYRYGKSAVAYAN